MKKFLTYLFMSVMLMSATVCAEETEASTVDIDLESMTSEELLSLKEAVMSEINSRDDLVEIIPQGAYVTGVDIKEGDYLLTTRNDEIVYVGVFGSEDDYAQYLKWKADSENEKRPTIETDASLWTDEDSVTVRLKENNVLYISTNNAVITSTEDNKPSWAP